MATNTKKLKSTEKISGQTKKSTAKKRSSLISEGILLALASACAYFFTFAYEKSYAAHFGIPHELVTVSLNTALLFFTIIVVFFGFLFMFLEISALIFRGLNPTLLQYILPIFGILLFTFIQMIFYGSNEWKRWIFLLILVFVIGTINFILPLFTQKGKGGFLEKLAAQQECAKNEVTFMGIVIGLFGLNPLILLLLFVFGYFLAVTAGTAEAVKRTEFLVIHSDPEIVVLRIYGDLAIGAPFNKDTKELENKFTSISIKQDPQTVFKLENVGPLTRPDKQQSVSNDSTILTPSPLRQVLSKL